ncbi:MAG: hypothetical protein MRJ92_13050 [Nitrospira sp.]|nr:hypothetical protein [Nitrospira sp.]
MEAHREHHHRRHPVALSWRQCVFGQQAGVGQFTKGIAQELAHENYRECRVARHYRYRSLDRASIGRSGLQGSPTQRLRLPSDIADVVAFPRGEEARWLTGQTIQAGGGIVM